MTKKLFSFLPIFFIILFALAIRLYALGSVAPGVSIDEVDYSLNAKSFVLTGKDLANKISPLQVLLFRYPGTDDVKAELPYLLHMPFDGTFPFSLFLARLPYVLMSVGSVFLLYLISKELLGRRIAIIASLVASINPYLVVLGRTSYEVVPATFFFLLSFFALLKARGAKILLTFPILLCAFYAYIGTKLLFVPFMLFVCFFVYFFIQKRKDGKYYLALSLLIVALVGVYLFLLHVNNTGGRLGTLLLPGSQRIADTVNAGRKASLDSPINSVVFNKFSVYGELLVGNLLPLFSGDYLFQTGDGFFRLYNHGVLYSFDLIFLLLGFAYLLGYKRKIGIAFLVFIGIATLPQVFFNAQGASPNYAHGTLIFPFFVIYIASGIEGLITFPKKDMYRKALLVGVSLIYVYSFLVFIQAYFFQYPLLGQDDYQTRILSRYISLASNLGKPVIVMSPVSVNHFKKYLFYSNQLNKATITDVKHAFMTGNIRLRMVTFTSCAKNPVFPKNTIVIEDSICGNADFMSHTSIPLLKDGGVSYKIYQDDVCKMYDLKRYPIGLTLSDFVIESMPRPSFCETFITNL